MPFLFQPYNCAPTNFHAIQIYFIPLASQVYWNLDCGVNRRLRQAMNARSVTGAVCTLLFFLVFCMALAHSGASANPAPKQPSPGGDYGVPTAWATLSLENIPYSEVVRLARAGELREILVRSNPGRFPNLFVLHVDGRRFRSVLPSLRLDSSVLESEVIVRADNGSVGDRAGGLVVSAGSILLTLALVVLVWLMIRQHRRSGPLERVEPAVKNNGKAVTFADVAGQDEAKAELREVVDFLCAPERFAALGARIPRGVLLEGDPGNGKTLLARAIAGESGVNFYHLDASGVVEMFAGMGPRRIRAAFRECRKRSPCILFIDELDSIGKKRGQGALGAQNEYDSVLNQMLTELDGVLRSNDRIVVVAATNRSDMLDPALVRPGRLDRKVFVAKPDLRGREAVLGVHTRNLVLAPSVDLRAVAASCPGFSAAEVANMANEAAIAAARRGASAVEPEDFVSARDRLVMGSERRSLLLDEAERRAVAVHEAGHAVVALRTPGADPVHRVTIIPRGRSLGAVIMLPERDSFLVTRERLEARLRIMLAGRAAERALLGEQLVTGGARGDFQEATAAVLEAAGRCGLGPSGGFAFHAEPWPGGAAGLSSERSRAALEDEAGRWLDRIASELDQDMVRLKEQVGRLAERLLEVETMTGDELRAFLGQEPSCEPAGAAGR